MSFPACALRETSLSRRVAGLCPVSRVMLSRCLLARHSACKRITEEVFHNNGQTRPGASDESRCVERAAADRATRVHATEGVCAAEGGFWGCCSLW